MGNASPLLTILALPMLGALATALMPKGNNALISRLLSLLVTLAVLALSGAIFAQWGSGPQAALDIPWIPSLGVNLHLAADGLNIYLLLLTALLFPVVLVCCWNRPETGNNLFLAMFLLLESTLLGTFLSQNLMLFFVFWEAVLIPMFVMILVFGGEKRDSAAFTFFMYTLAGSVLFLAAVLMLGYQAMRQTGSWSFELATLSGLALDWQTQVFVFSAIMLACAIKCPLFPFHSWLPPAYCEAPFAGTAIMAGAMSKMGAFGILKLAIPLCPDVARAFGPRIMALAVISIVYGAIIALRQTDFRRLVAYSSLSHMGYIVLGLFSFHQAAFHGAMFQILSHGVSVAGLFLILALLEQRLGGDYPKLTALSTRAPRLAVVLMLFILSSVALPLTSGFTSEFLILFGSFQSGLALWKGGMGVLGLAAVLVAASGMVLGAGYMLRFARTILYGETGEGSLADLDPREGIALLPLLIVIVWIGVMPGSILDHAGRTNNAAAGQPLPAARAVAVTAPAAVNGGANGR